MFVAFFEEKLAIDLLPLHPSYSRQKFKMATLLGNEPGTSVGEAVTPYLCCSGDWNHNQVLLFRQYPTTLLRKDLGSLLPRSLALETVRLFLLVI